MKRIIQLALLAASLLLTSAAHAQATLPQSLDFYFALPPSGYVQARSLAASTAETITPPTDARFVLISCTANVYVAFNSGTATVPSDTTDGTASELNPTMRRISSSATISVISPVAAVCTAAFYK